MFKNRLELVKNLMQIMHITLSFYVQEAPLAYISSLVLTFYNILYVLVFLSFSRVFSM